MIAIWFRIRPGCWCYARIYEEGHRIAADRVAVALFGLQADR